MSSTVPPPPPTPPAPPPPATGGNGAATATTAAPPPVALLRAAAGTQIPAEVLPPRADQPANTVRVRASVGEVLLRTPAPLPEGARITLELTATTDRAAQFRILNVNGQTLADFLAARGTGQAAAPQPGQAGSFAGLPGQTSSLSAGQLQLPTGPVQALGSAGLYAQVTGPGGAGAQGAGGQTGPFATGTQMTVRIAGLTLPGGNPQSASFAVQAQSGAGTGGLPGADGNSPGGQSIGNQTIGGQPSGARGGGLTLLHRLLGTAQPGAQSTGGFAPGQVPGQAAGQAQPGQVPAGQTAPGQAASGQPVPGQTAPGQAGGVTPGQAGTTQAGPGQTSPGQPVPGAATGATQTGNSPATTPALATLTGTVTGTGPGSTPLIQTPGGLLALGHPANLPVGTEVRLEITELADARSGSQRISPFLPSPTNAPGGAWPALSEGLAMLRGGDPGAAQALANALPDGGARSLAAMVSFLQAMRTGEPRQWPGTTTLDALSRLGPRGSHLARQIGGEVTEMSSRARDSSPAEGRQFWLPFIGAQEIDRIGLFVRRDGGDDEEDQARKQGTGYRFVLNFDFSRLGPMAVDGLYVPDRKALDVIIKSTAPLADTMHRDLQGIFATSLSALGLAGSLNFQVSATLALPDGGNTGPERGSGSGWYA